MSFQNQSVTYIGRFAPSPTGPLHLGSLLAALGSFLQARHRQGKWLVRIEDLDPPREVPGASTDILKTLEYFHLFWDDDIVYQSHRSERYDEIINELLKNDLIFPCTCSRKTIQATAQIGPLGMIYPGTCRPNRLPLKQQHSLRLLLPDQDINFKDTIQPALSLNLMRDIGDVVLLRADGFYAYHLAVVVDDEDQHVSEIVRGTDLLYSTPVHQYLQQCLNYNTPNYIHLPVIENARGEKLSKQTGASKVSFHNPEKTLLQLLNMLGQNPAEELQDGSLDEILTWAINHWDINKVPTENIKLT